MVSALADKAAPSTHALAQPLRGARATVQMAIRCGRWLGRKRMRAC